MNKRFFIALVPFLFLGEVANAQTPNAPSQQVQQQTLTAKQSFYAQIAALTAVGDVARLSSVLHQALDSGVTVNEIKDLMVQLYAYSGFPRSLNALTTLQNVQNERQTEGKNTVIGRTATPLPAGSDMFAIGTQTQTQVVGTPVNIAVSDDIDRYLKQHLFGAIFASDLLNHQEREIVTVAALAAMEQVEPQLIAHFKVSRNVGLTNAQLGAVLEQVAKLNPRQGERAKQLLREH